MVPTEGKCLVCGSRRVVAGWNGSRSGLEGLITLQLDFARSWFRRLFLGGRDQVPVDPNFQVCLDCGLVCSQIDREVLLSWTEMFSNPQLRDRFGFLPPSPLSDPDLDDRLPATKGQ